jgi:hypothetical protein
LEASVQAVHWPADHRSAAVVPADRSAYLELEAWKVVHLPVEQRSEALQQAARLAGELRPEAWLQAVHLPAYLGLEA